jgi:hypothetical protein
MWDHSLLPDSPTLGAPFFRADDSGRTSASAALKPNMTWHPDDV